MKLKGASGLQSERIFLPPTDSLQHQNEVKTRSERFGSSTLHWGDPSTSGGNIFNQNTLRKTVLVFKADYN